MSSTSARMNTGERQALRQVVRQRMKVLRADVNSRKAELVAEAQERVAASYADRDKALAELNQQAADIVEAASINLRTLARSAEVNLGLSPGQLGVTAYPTPPRFAMLRDDKGSMLRRLYAEIEAQVAAALVQIDRQEADLIEEITVDGLETDAAKNFLARIPTVGQLVPASRIKEITA